MQSKIGELYKQQNSEKPGVFHRIGDFLTGGGTKYHGRSALLDSFQTEALQSKFKPQYGLKPWWMSPETPEPIRDVQAGIAPKAKIQRPSSISQQQWDLLSDDEKLEAARVGAGIKPKSTASNLPPFLDGASEEDKQAYRERQIYGPKGKPTFFSQIGDAVSGVFKNLPKASDDAILLSKLSPEQLKDAAETKFGLKSKAANSKQPDESKRRDSLLREKKGIQARLDKINENLELYKDTPASKDWLGREKPASTTYLYKDNKWGTVDDTLLSARSDLLKERDQLKKRLGQINSGLGYTDESESPTAKEESRQPGEGNFKAEPGHIDRAGAKSDGGEKSDDINNWYQTQIKLGRKSQADQILMKRGMSQYIRK